MRTLCSVFLALLSMTHFSSAEPFQEITVCIPVALVVEAKARLLKQLGQIGPNMPIGAS